MQVLIHCLSKSESHRPFSKIKGLVQAIAFHPFRPLFFVATQQTVFLYNLQKQVNLSISSFSFQFFQSLIKKMISGSKSISCISIHPEGDNVIVGTGDKRVVWFDIDLGSKPYKTFKYHNKSIRDVNFHPRYPLFASSDDDMNINIFQ